METTVKYLVYADLPTPTDLYGFSDLAAAARFGRLMAFETGRKWVLRYALKSEKICEKIFTPNINL